MYPKAYFELCAFNVPSCIIAEKARAIRAELCDNPLEGGTTPSYGTIRKAREKTTIKLYPIIRPRSDHYFYTEEEIEIMKDDILMCKDLGCDGISIGVQNENGTIDKDTLSRFVEWAYPMGVTCNRAFDVTPDPFEALEDIIAAGCERILTSGQKSAAPEAANLLAQLVKQADSRIIIMPGAGITSGNIQELRKKCGATEFHGSLRKAIRDELVFTNPAVTDAGAYYLPDVVALRSIVEQLSETNI